MAGELTTGTVGIPNGGGAGQANPQLAIPAVDTRLGLDDI
jgi:hypothetical protein